MSADKEIKGYKISWKVYLTTGEYLASIGQKGGKSGTGKAKRRGNVAYYKKLSKKAALKRRNKK